MKLYKCTDHAQFNPVGCASIVLAENTKEAHRLLRSALRARGLPDKPFTLLELPLDKGPYAWILCDGEY